MPKGESISKGDAVSPEHFLAFTDALPDPFLFVRVDGSILAGNRCFMDQFQLSGPLRGNLLDSVKEREDFSHYLRLCGRTRNLLFGAVTVTLNRKEERCRAEGTLVEPADTVAGAKVLLRLLPKGGVGAKFVALTLHRDQLASEIRRRKQMEEELRQQRAWFQVTLESIGDGVIATDETGAVVFMNRLAETMTGWPFAEVRNRPLREIFRIVNEDTKCPVEDPVSKVTARGSIIGLTNHTVLLTRGGGELAIEDSAAPIRDGQGRVIGVVLVFHDVTSRRKAELSLVRSQNDLQERLKELEAFHDAVVGRELKMMELETEIARLRKQVPEFGGQP
jgi:PAS domain S-box-containing protein